MLFSNTVSTDFFRECEYTIWMGIKRSSTNTSKWFSTIDNNEVDFLPWAEGEPNGVTIDEDCIAFTRKSDKYVDVKCSGKRCFSCQFKQNTIFHLKGLCDEQDFIDRNYVLQQDKLKAGKLEFYGLSEKSFIVTYPNSTKWELMSFKSLKQVFFLDRLSYLVLHFELKLN